MQTRRTTAPLLIDLRDLDARGGVAAVAQAALELVVFGTDRQLRGDIKPVESGLRSPTGWVVGWWWTPATTSHCRTV
jgi:hypothetical protein